jgi:hypothetical protein
MKHLLASRRPRSTAPRSGLLAAVCGLLIASPASAQLRAPAYAWSELRGLHPTTVARAERLTPQRSDANRRMATGTMAVLAAEGGAWVGLVSGIAVGGAICNAIRDRSGDSLRFLPGMDCLENDFQVYGAVVGSFATSSLVVLKMSERSGCDFNDVRRRALRGAMLGTLPAIAWMAARPSVVTPGDIRLEWKPEVTAVVVGTPVLQALGATIAASRCRHAR